MRFNVLASKFNWRSHSPFPSWRSKILCPFSNLPVSIFSAPLQAFLVLESPNLHHHPSSCVFISSHQFTCQLVTIHPPLLRSSPGFDPANEATTTLLCPDELSWGGCWIFVCVCGFSGRDCMIFVSMQPWFLLSLPYSEVILMVSPQKWRSSVFPYELFLWSPSYGFSVPSMSSVKNSPARNLGPLRWTLREMDKKHQDI